MKRGGCGEAGGVFGVHHRNTKSPCMIEKEEKRGKKRKKDAYNTRRARRTKHPRFEEYFRVF